MPGARQLARVGKHRAGFPRAVCGNSRPDAIGIGIGLLRVDLKHAEPAMSAPGERRHPSTEPGGGF
jgi:hypothetical protein